MSRRIDLNKCQSQVREARGATFGPQPQRAESTWAMWGFCGELTFNDWSAQARSMNGADLIVARLKAQGVKWISTLCGNGMDPLYDACRRADVRVIDFHNEQGAAYAADAYARLTRALGVCAVSSGIAHSNALTGLANAYFDGAPVLLITGASSGFGAGIGVFQEFDQAGLAAPICKYSDSVLRIEDLGTILERAIALSLAPRQGPVHITVPRDVLESETSLTPPYEALPEARVGPAERRVVGLLSKKVIQAERPLLVAGTRLAASAGWGALVRFSEAYEVPFAVPIWDRGCVEKPHPNFVGVLGAASGQPDILSEADLVILAGADADYRVGYLSPPGVRKEAATIRIEGDPAQFARGASAKINVAGDPVDVLEQLSQMPPNQPNLHAGWLETCRSRWAEFRRAWIGEQVCSEPMSGRDIVEAIRPLLSEDLLFLIDGGNIGQWAHMALGDHYPSNWLTCGASAVVGWGIPGAMGVRLADQSRPILLLSGDGAFGFTLSEIESAARQNLPFVAVVANDSAWGIVVCGQKAAWGSTIACETSDIRFDQVAKALGARGIRVTDPGKLTSAIRTALRRRETTVIDVPIRVCSPTDARRAQGKA